MSKQEYENLILSLTAVRTVIAGAVMSIEAIERSIDASFEAPVQVPVPEDDGVCRHPKSISLGTMGEPNLRICSTCDAQFNAGEVRG